MQVRQLVARWIKGLVLAAANGSVPLQIAVVWALAGKAWRACKGRLTAVRTWGFHAINKLVPVEGRRSIQLRPGWASLSNSDEGAHAPGEG